MKIHFILRAKILVQQLQKHFANDRFIHSFRLDRRARLGYCKFSTDKKNFTSQNKATTTTNSGTDCHILGVDLVA
jgi:hypothetical protein